MKKVTSWSFSKYQLYQQCPLKFKFIAIDKLKEPPSKALKHGVEVHKIIEDYIKDGGDMPKACQDHFPLEFENLRNIFSKKTSGALVEENWAFTKNWMPTVWDDWTGAWVRAKIDCVYTRDDGVVIINDWKTGKFSPEYNLETYLQQLELYALSAFLMIEHAEVIHPRLVFVEAGVVYPRHTDTAIVYTRDQLPELKERWADRVSKMFLDTSFFPKKNKFCYNCYFRKSNGGACPVDL